eukprot:16752-Heterococcus_DN1.PRE.1
MAAIKRAATAACTLETAFGLSFSERFGFAAASAAARGSVLVPADPVFTKPVVSACELQYALAEVRERVRVLDGSCFGPQSSRHAHDEFKQKHIIGAAYFDLDDTSSKATPLPKMLPKADAFAKQVSDLGINNHHHVVVYNSQGANSAARVWWAFQVFGHRSVHVLQGGLQ